MSAGRDVSQSQSLGSGRRAVEGGAHGQELGEVRVEEARASARALQAANLKRALAREACELRKVGEVQIVEARERASGARALLREEHELRLKELLEHRQVHAAPRRRRRELRQRSLHERQRHRALHRRVACLLLYGRGVGLGEREERARVVAGCELRRRGERERRLRGRCR
eukprot:2154154-Rhodomonas_salina.2